MPDITNYDGQLQKIARNLGEEPELTTTDALLEAIAEGTENIATQEDLEDYLPLSGGTMTGAITLADGGTALSDATVGTTETNSIESSVSIPASTATEITSVSLTAGTWVVTGHVRYSGYTSGHVAACSISDYDSAVNFATDGSTCFHTSATVATPLQTVRIMTFAIDKTVYLNGYANEAITCTNATITAVRIV